ncbi:hypothetical protein [Actinomadura gamaensis]|uniref:Ornithine cyclodeaminase n=1 Tax=Actinomadura gamaensis TaxID=1763541 RepID=A0ABV9U178_9ACTN
MLLDRDALRPLFTEPHWIEESFGVVERALTAAAGRFAWLHMPLSGEAGDDGDQRVNVQVETVPDGGGYVRAYPGRSAAPPAGHPALLLDSGGRLLGLLAADDLNAWRTAAPVAVAARHLARPGARTVTVLGSGRQAEHLIRALRVALPAVDTIHIHSRTPEHRERLATAVHGRAVADPADALAAADVIAVTDGGHGDLLAAHPPSPGALVTAIMPLPLRTDRLVVPTFDGPEGRPSGWDPPHGPPGAAAGREPGEADATLAEVVAGAAAARTDPGQVVLYDQRGQFGWDHALLLWAFRRMTEAGRGVPFELA